MKEIMETVAHKLDYIKSQLKEGRFDKTLIIQVNSLRDMVNTYGAAISDNDEIAYLKSKCIMSEVYYYFGKIDEARRAVAEGGKIFEQLKDQSTSRPEGDRRLTRERIRFSLAHTQAYFYRDNQYKECKERITVCRDLIGKLKSADFPCWGSQAQIAHALARTLRQLNQFDLSEKAFVECIDYYYERAELKRRLYEEDNQRDPKTLQAEVSFSTYRSAIALGLGLGWVNFTKGQLTLALHHNIIPARTLLAHTPDTLNKAYLGILYASIKRCLADDSVAELEAAIKVIHGARAEFERAEHWRYVARSCYELSLAHLYLSYLYKQQRDSKSEAEQIRKARENIARVLSLSLQKPEDWRWVSNAYTVQSRIERWAGNLGEAERLATEALNTATEHQQLLCKIDAHLARAKVRIKLGEVAGAQFDLQEAHDLNNLSSTEDENHPAPPAAEPRNPRIQAVCYLNHARLCILNQKMIEAGEYLLLGKGLLKGVEHVIVHKLANKIEDEIARLPPDFVIRGGDRLKDNLNYEYYNWGLRDFLIRQAYMQTNSDEKACKLLAVNRGTLKDWKQKIQKRRQAKTLYTP